MKTYIRFAVLLLGASIVFQGCNKYNEITPDMGPTDCLEFITVSLEDSPRSRAAHEMDGTTLKTFWEAGDRIAVAPALGLGHSGNWINAGIYEVTEPGSATSPFRLVSAIGQNGDITPYGIFYPGDQILEIQDYSKFSYAGQVQKKSDPMGHLSDYHTMYVKTNDYSTISFSGADQSSCLKVSLRGMTFHNPVKIEVEVLGRERFFANNYVNEPYYHFTDDFTAGQTRASKVSINLEGYTDETSIDAWIMMPNSTVELSRGDNLRVLVTQQNGDKYSAILKVPQKTTLTGGKWHNLTIRNGWQAGEASADVDERDGQVVEIQEGVLAGLDIVIMGDGFIGEDLDNGTYDAVMREAYANFFSVEPYKTLKAYFSVYYVKVVSPARTDATNTGANGAINNSYDTTFGCTFTPNRTHMEGDNDLAIEYAKKALGTNANTRIKNATIIVVANQQCRAGTCYNSWNPYNTHDWGDECCAIAYSARGRDSNEFKYLITHEAGGHGFGKLADEYTGKIYVDETTVPFESLFREMDDEHSLGLYRNVDKCVVQSMFLNPEDWPPTNNQNVYWHDLFGTVNNYESEEMESLGVFEGANTFNKYYCRPTQDGSKSIMNSGSFYNAPSRRAILYRINSLMKAGGYGTNISFGSSYELTDFLYYDKFYGAAHASAADSAPSSTVPPMLDIELNYDHNDNVLIEGEWVDGKFIPSAQKAKAKPIRGR